MTLALSKSSRTAARIRIEQVTIGCSVSYKNIRSSGRETQTWRRTRHKWEDGRRFVLPFVQCTRGSKCFLRRVWYTRVYHYERHGEDFGRSNEGRGACGDDLPFPTTGRFYNVLGLEMEEGWGSTTEYSCKHQSRIERSEIVEVRPVPRMLNSYCTKMCWW